MSNDKPQTVREWQSYFATLSGEPLWEKAAAANSVSFVRMLQDEGYSAKDIHSIFIHIARRFQETGERPPGDGLYDFDVLARDELPKN